MEHLGILIITALILAYASVLLFIRLRSEGVPAARIKRALIELWGVFVLIIGTFILSNRLLGDVPRSGFPGELTDRWTLFFKLPPAQQALLGVALLFSLALFIHFLWSLRALKPADKPTRD
ncbi:MAG: hypothetical protein ACYC7E_16305 [Armatimonadota bacterium]